MSGIRRRSGECSGEFFSRICLMLTTRTHRMCRYLRTDGLGLLLTKVGVRSHSKMAVFEEGVGLLTSAIAERLGGTTLRSPTAQHSCCQR